jgi:hypothetical protein
MKDTNEQVFEGAPNTVRRGSAALFNTSLQQWMGGECMRARK